MGDTLDDVVIVASFGGYMIHHRGMVVKDRAHVATVVPAGDIEVGGVPHVSIWLLHYLVVVGVAGSLGQCPPSFQLSSMRGVLP